MSRRFSLKFGLFFLAVLSCFLAVLWWPLPDVSRLENSLPSVNNQEVPQSGSVSADKENKILAAPQSDNAAKALVFQRFANGPGIAELSHLDHPAELRTYAPAWHQVDLRGIKLGQSFGDSLWTIVQIFSREGIRPVRLETVWQLSASESAKPWPQREAVLIRESAMAADEVTFKLLEGFTPPDCGDDVAFGPPDSESGIISAVLKNWRNTSEIDTVLQKLRFSSGVAWAEPNFHVDTVGVPNDALYSSEWHTKATGVNLEWLWDRITDATTVPVAVIDTFFETTHPDLQGNLAPGYAFLRGSSNVGLPAQRAPGDTHGTHVAGIVAARGNNGVGVSGAAWRGRVLPMATGVGSWITRKDGSTYFGYRLDTSAIIRSFDWARSNAAKVFNCSFGSYDWNQGAYEAISRAAQANILVVCAAGNDKVNTDNSPHFPGCYPLENILNSGASTSSQGKASFSNKGKSSVDLFAPGSEILSTVPVADGAYEFYDGTSMASPLVAGTAALLRARYTSLSALDIKTALIRSARQGAAFTDWCIAGGTLDARSAVEYIDSKFTHGQGVRFGRGDVTLRIDDVGQVHAWGNGFAGLLGDGTNRFSISPVAVPGMSNAVAVAVLKNKIRVLRLDGTVWWWGRGASSSVVQATPVQMPGLADIVDISADNRDIFYYLRRDGTWYSEEFGKHGSFDTLATGINLISEGLAIKPNGTTLYREVVLPASGSWTYGGPTLPATFKRVSVDLNVTLVADLNQEVWVKTDNRHGQRGNGTVINGPIQMGATFVKVPNLSNITDVSTCGFSCAALRADGRVFYWGLRPGAGSGDTNVLAYPQLVPLPAAERAVGIAMVRNRKGSGVDGVARNRAAASVPFNSTEFADEVGMLFVECSSGKVYALGNNTFGALGTGTGLYAFPEPIANLLPTSQDAFNSVESSTVWIDVEGVKVSGFDGSHSRWEYSVGSTDAELMFGYQRTGKRVLWPDGEVTPTRVACGSGVFFGWRSGGDLFAWGRNSSGMLGTNFPLNLAFATAPVKVNGIASVSRVAVGSSHVLALTSNGNVYAWGSNGSGQLALGGKDSNNHPEPTLVSGLSNVTEVAASENCSFALTGDGRLWSWGRGGSSLDFALGVGKLLPETAANSTVPVNLTVGGTVINSVANFWAGYGRLYWRHMDGTVKVLGNNELNATGLGGGVLSTVTSTSGVIPALSTATTIALRRGGGIASLANGKVYTWGGNRFGLLGNSQSDLNSAQVSPVEIPALRGRYTWIKGGRNSLFAAQANGGVFAWGNAWVGTIPNGSAWLVAPAPMLGFGGIANFLASSSSVGSTPSWLEANFSQDEIAQREVVQDCSDPDGDGWCNVLEYALGTDPRFANEHPATIVTLEKENADSSTDDFTGSIVEDLNALANYSFESQVLTLGTYTNATPPGWQESQVNGPATFTEHVGGFVSHGTNHQGIQNHGAIWQDITITLAPKTRYTLIVGVGHRVNWTLSGNATVFEFQVAEGNQVTTLASRTVDAFATVPAGAFVDHSLIFETGDVVPPGGIRVWLGVNSSDRAHFDNIRLTCQAIQPSHLVLSAPRNGIAADVVSIVEVSDDLIHWFSGEPHTVTIADTPSLLKVMDATPVSNSRRRYMRLRIERSGLNE